MPANREDEANEIKRRYAAQYLQKPEVSGFGVEKNEAGQYVIAIHVNTQDPAILQQFPKSIEGYPVKIIPSGPFRAFTGQ